MCHRDVGVGRTETWESLAFAGRDCRENAQHSRERRREVSLGWHVCSKCLSTSSDAHGCSDRRPQLRHSPGFSGGFLCWLPNSPVCSQGYSGCPKAKTPVGCGRYVRTSSPEPRDTQGPGAHLAERGGGLHLGPLSQMCGPPPGKVFMVDRVDIHPCVLWKWKGHSPASHTHSLPHLAHPYCLRPSGARPQASLEPVRNLQKGRTD